MEKSNFEPMFQLNSPSTLSMDGSVAKALKIACDAFMLNGRDMRGFIITISEKDGQPDLQNDSEKVFIVTFMGKLSAGKRGLGTANRVPGSVTFFVSTKKWEIIKEQGVK